MYYTYVLKSQKDGKYYIGSTQDVERRLRFHNNGLNTSTRSRCPFVVVFQKRFLSRKEALTFERLLKKQKGGIGFTRLVFGK